MTNTLEFLPRPTREEADRLYHNPTDQDRANADTLVDLARQIAVNGEPIYGYPTGSVLCTPLATVHQAWHYPDSAWESLNGIELPGGLRIMVALNSAGTKRTKYAEIGAYPAEFYTPAYLNGLNPQRRALT